MDSVQFCGQVCHKVMKPEFDRATRTARTRASPACSATSARARPGSRKSKLSGTRQVLAVMLPHLLAADPVAGAEPAARARHLRAVPLAGEVPRRQGPARRRVRRRREEHRVGDDAAGARRRRQRAAGHRHRHPLAHERRQRGRVHRHRRQAAGDSVRPRQGSRAATCASTPPRGSRPSSLRKASAGAWTAWTATTVRAIRWRRPPSAPSTRRSRAARFPGRCRSCVAKRSRC